MQYPLYIFHEVLVFSDPASFISENCFLLSTPSSEPLGNFFVLFTSEIFRINVLVKKVKINEWQGCLVRQGENTKSW